MNILDAHRYYLERARVASLESLDPSTKIGAVLVHRTPDQLADTRADNLDYYEVIAEANNFPDGVLATPERLNDRPTKYAYILHAEWRLLLSLLRSVMDGHYHTLPRIGDCTLYVYGLPVCGECAGPIVHVGIKHVVFADLEHEPGKQDTFRRWKNSSDMGSDKFRDAGVSVVAVKLEPALS